MTHRWVPTTVALVAALVAVIATTVAAIAGNAGDSATVTFPNADRFGPVEISAELYVPDGEGPFPAVVQLHGSSGLFDQDYIWAAELRDMGYVALVIDSQGSRGLAYPLSANAHNQMIDFYGALAYLQSLNFVDTGRIAIAGWSQGAGTALHMVRTDTIKTPEHRVQRVGERVGAIVAFYPRCMITDGFDVPVLILIGERDDVTGASACVFTARHAMNMQSPGSIDLVVYPDATHAFDFEFLADPAWTAAWAEKFPGLEAVAGGLRSKRHFYAYDAAAHADSIARVEAFLAEHLGRASAEGATAGD